MNRRSLLKILGLAPLAALLAPAITWAKDRSRAKYYSLTTREGRFRVTAYLEDGGQRVVADIPAEPLVEGDTIGLEQAGNRIAVRYKGKVIAHDIPADAPDFTAFRFDDFPPMDNWDEPNGVFDGGANYTPGMVIRMGGPKRAN